MEADCITSKFLTMFGTRLIKHFRELLALKERTIKAQERTIEIQNQIIEYLKKK